MVDGRAIDVREATRAHRAEVEVGVLAAKDGGVVAADALEALATEHARRVHEERLFEEQEREHVRKRVLRAPGAAA